MTWTETLENQVNREAEREYQFQRDPYEFAMKHLWLPRFVSWSGSAYHAFGADLRS